MAWNPILNKFNPALFWDIDINSINIDQNAAFIVERILTRGDWLDWLNLKTLYPPDKLKNISLNLRFLDDKTHNFLAMYFNISLESFRCYTEKSLNKGHLPY